MLIFHEGLPGSGKSFAAMVDHIIPALIKGRHVYAYIEGLDVERIAEAADLPVDQVRDLLHQITRDQVPQIHAHIANDSLVVLDELQNFWPSGRQRLDADITQFVTEHRHRGLDILCMGQVLNDCHALWKGRIDTKIVFQKRDAIGKADEYKWSVQKNTGAGKFKETTSGKKKYDAKYFGCYASHTDDTENTATYEDSRANVKNSKAFKAIKIYGLVAVVALGFVVWFFVSGGGGMGQKKLDPVASKSAVDPNAIAAAQNAKVVAAQSSVPPAAVDVAKSGDMFSGAAQDYIDQLSDKGRIRLSGTLRSAKRISGYIEWRDGSNRVIEKFAFDELRGLGWYVMISADGGMATLSRPGKTYVATQWPTVDDRSAAPERVPDDTTKRLRADFTPGQVAANPMPAFPGQMGLPSSVAPPNEPPAPAPRQGVVPMDSPMRFKG